MSSGTRKRDKPGQSGTNRDRPARDGRDKGRVHPFRGVPFCPPAGVPPRASCSGKTRFPTFAEARDHAKRASRRTETSFNPYHCNSCGFYHYGARPFQKAINARFRREREEFVLEGGE